METLKLYIIGPCLRCQGGQMTPWHDGDMICIQCGCVVYAAPPLEYKGNAVGKRRLYA